MPSTGIQQIVMLHGWGGSHASVWRAHGWEARLEQAGYVVTGIDLPGHGASEPHHDPRRYADLATEVARRLPRRAGLIGIGYSLGAKVLLELAARAPDTFGTLVLAGLGANVFAPETMGEQVASALEHGVHQQTQPAVRALVEYGLAHGNDPLALAACLRRSPNPALTRLRLERLRCRTLLVAGDQDRMAMPLDPLADALHASHSVVLAGVDHLNLPAVPACMDTVMRFLSGPQPVDGCTIY